VSGTSIANRSGSRARQQRGPFGARCRWTIAADPMLDLGSNIGAACWFVRMSAAIGILGMPPQRAPHWAMRRWCRGRHQRYLQNTPAETPRQTQPSDPRPSRSCQGSAARRRGQCPKPRRIAIAVGAQRRGIDGAEHSAKIERVMAGGSSDQGGGILATKTCAIVACASGWNAVQIVSGIVRRFLRRFSVARET